MFSARVKVGKRDFCIILAGKQQKRCDRAPFRKFKLGMYQIATFLAGFQDAMPRIEPNNWARNIPSEKY